MARIIKRVTLSVPLPLSVGLTPHRPQRTTETPQGRACGAEARTTRKGNGLIFAWNRDAPCFPSDVQAAGWQADLICRKCEITHLAFKPSNHVTAQWEAVMTNRGPMVNGEGQAGLSSNPDSTACQLWAMRPPG